MQDQDELTPQERELERALKMLRPAPARLDPVAAASTARLRASHRRVRAWQTAAAAAILVAAGVWAALGPRDTGPPHLDQLTAAPEAQGGRFATHAVESTTWLVYRRALAQSPAALDALLDAQAATNVAHHAEITPASVLTYWNSILPRTLGEM